MGKPGTGPDALPLGMEALREVRTGEGTEGFLGRLEGRENPVFLKMALASADADVARDLKRESQLLSSIRHPSFPRPIAQGEWQGRAYSVREWVEGTTLSSSFATTTREDWDRVAMDLLGALAVLHEMDVCHHDISPSNLLRVSSGPTTIALIDLGMAGKQGRRYVGTPAYMAPEVLRGEPSTTESDLYSAGRILAEVALGHPLSEGRTAREILERTNAGRAHALNELEAVLDSKRFGIVSRLLCPRREERQTDAVEALLAWHELDAARCEASIQRTIRSLVTSGWSPTEEALARWNTQCTQENTQAGHSVHLTITGPMERVAAASIIIQASALTRGYVVRTDPSSGLEPTREIILDATERIAYVKHKSSSTPHAVQIDTTDVKCWKVKESLRKTGLDDASAAYCATELERSGLLGRLSIEELLLEAMKRNVLVRKRRAWVLLSLPEECLVAGLDRCVSSSYASASEEQRRAIRLVGLACEYPDREAQRWILQELQRETPSALPETLIGTDGVSKGGVPNALVWRAAGLGLTAEDAQELHRILAEYYDNKPGLWSAAAYHWLAAGDTRGKRLSGALERCFLRGRRLQQDAFLSLLESSGEYSDSIRIVAMWMAVERGDWEKVSSWLKSIDKRTECTELAWFIRRAQQGDLTGVEPPRRPWPHTGKFYEVCRAEAKDAESRLERIKRIVSHATGVPCSELAGATSRLAEWGARQPFYRKHVWMAGVNELAAALARERQYSRAKQVLATGMMIAARWRLRTWGRRFRINHANCELNEGRLAAALRSLERTALQCERAGEADLAAVAWRNVGSIHYRNGERGRAIASWERPMGSFFRSRREDDLLDTAAAIGVALRSIGMWKRGEGVLTDASNRAREINAESQAVRLDAGLAETRWLKGEIGSALSVTEGRADRVSGEVAQSLRLIRQMLRVECGRPPMVTAANVSPEPACATWRVWAWSRMLLGSTGPEPKYEEGTGAGGEWNRTLRWRLGLLKKENGAQFRKVESRLRGGEMSPGNVFLATVCLDSLIADEDSGKKTAGHRVEEVAAFAERCGFVGLMWRAHLARGLKALRKGSLGPAAKALSKAVLVLEEGFRSRETGRLPDDLLRRRDVRALVSAVGRLSYRLRGEETGLNSSVEGVEAVFASLQAELVECALGARESVASSAEQWRRGVASIVSITKVLNSTMELDDLLEEIVDRLLDVCDAEHAFVVILDERGRQVVKVAGGELPTGLASIDEEVSRTVVRNVCATRSPLVVKNALDRKEFLDSASVKALSLRSLMCAPLLHKGRLLGVLYADNRSASGRFGSQDLQLLEVLANQAAIAIHGNQVYQELRSSYKALEQAYEQSVRAERLKVLGELAGGVAHDFNNLLTAILVRAQLLQQGNVGERERRELGLIERAAMDGAEAIRRIQDYTRMKRGGKSKRFEIGPSIRDCVEFTRGRWGRAEERIDVAVEGQFHGWVLGNESEIREVFTNLILNAVDAMPKGGTLRIQGELSENRVRVRFRDTGTGIAPEVQERIFDPFFTTKGEKGNGLGLSVAYGIILRHGGLLSVESAPGKGAEFIVELPRAARGSTDAETEGVQVREGTRVLLVDDDPLVREGLSASLEGCGCDVVAVEGAGAALDLLERGGEFDVVLSDERMPDIGGKDLFRELRNRRQAGKLVLMTGSYVEVNPSDMKSLGVDCVLWKPFSLDALCRAISPGNQGQMWKEKEPSPTAAGESS